MTIPSKGQFIWHELMTPDSKTSLAFYQRVLGITAETSKMPDGRDYHVLSSQGRGFGGMLDFDRAQLAAGMKSFWVGYVSSADVDGQVARVQKHGGAVQIPAFDIPGVGRMAGVTDPQGAGFMVFNPTPPPGEVPPPATGPGSVGWNELFTTDVGAAFAFYSELFGWEKDMTVDMGPMGIYQTFKTGDLAGGGMMKDPDPTPVPRWRYVFRTEAIDAAISRAKESGGKLTFGPDLVPGGDWVAHLEDPHGAYLGLVSSKR